MTERIPTTDNVRVHYIYYASEPLDALNGELEAREREFDRWLAEHDAQVLEEAADAYYNNVSGSKTRPWARTFLRERAARIRGAQKE